VKKKTTLIEWDELLASENDKKATRADSVKLVGIGKGIKKGGHGEKVGK